MAQVVFGSREAQAVLEKDRPLREAAAKEVAIEKAKRTARLESYEVFIQEDPPPERSVIVKAYSEEEAQEIARNKHVRVGEIISDVRMVKR